jgi:hypothetical protein
MPNGARVWLRLRLRLRLRLLLLVSFSSRAGLLLDVAEGKKGVIFRISTDRLKKNVKCEFAEETLLLQRYSFVL